MDLVGGGGFEVGGGGGGPLLTCSNGPDKLPGAILTYFSTTSVNGKR